MWVKAQGKHSTEVDQVIMDVSLGPAHINVITGIAVGALTGKH